MSSEKGEKQIAKGRRTIWRSWRFLIGGAFFFLTIGLLVFIFLPEEWDWEEIGNTFVREWNRENRESLRQFRELARENGWVMYARHGKMSLGLLDFSTMDYRPIYLPRPGRWVLNAGASGERIALTECKAEWTGEDYACSEFQIGIVEVHGSVITTTKVPLEDESLSSDRGAHAIAVGKDLVLCLSKERAHVYEISSKTLRTVYEVEETERYDRKRRALVVGEKYLLLFMSQGTIPRSCHRLIALDASGAYRVLSELDSVWYPNAIVIGGRVLIEKGEDCFLYNPKSGETQKLVSGRLLVPLGDGAFLFRDENEVYRYDLSNRSAASVWSAPAYQVPYGRKNYDYAGFTVSPDGLFIFAPWVIEWRKAPRIEGLEYEVYYLPLGEKRGAFHPPYVGRGLMEFLGWVEDEEAE